MKFEAGFKKVVNGIPKELEAAAKCLSRACHKVEFYKTESDIYYAAGELASGVMADVYLRYESRVKTFKEKETRNPAMEIIVTIICYGIYWLPILGRPQLCVYERKIDVDPAIVIAECWSNILGASAMFPLIDAGNAFNRKIAEKLVLNSEEVLPTKVFRKLHEKYALKELPGMPPTPKTDVLAAFVGYTQGYVLPRVASAHKDFYYSLFQTNEVIVTIEEPQLFQTLDNLNSDEEEDLVNTTEIAKNETPIMEEVTKTSPLDEPVKSSKPSLGIPKPRGANPSAGTQPIEQRIAFKFPELAKFSENLISNWRVQNPEITDAEIWTCWTKWVEGREKYLAQQQDTTAIQKAAEGGSPVYSGSETVPPRKPSVPSLGLPKRKQ